MKVHYLKNWQYWYDTSYKCWYAVKFDADGDQIGSCVDAYTKDEILLLIKRELED